jgi:hypothetical protein
LITNDKIERAEEIIKMMARINGKPTPDTSEIKILAKSIANAGKNYLMKVIPEVCRVHYI